MNLLQLVPHLNDEDFEAIPGAVGTGPSGLLTKYTYYRDAARDRVYIGMVDYEVAIAALAQMPFWPQARATACKLKKLHQSRDGSNG
jgi:hypothetical protein